MARSPRLVTRCGGWYAVSRIDPALLADPELWAAFERLLELPAAQRAQALAAVNAHHASALARLLAAHDEKGLLDVPLPAPAAGSELFATTDPMDPRGDPAALPVGTMVGSWTLEGVLGTGGMATVYLAHRLLAGGGRQIAAIKVLAGLAASADPARLQREQAVLTRLDHPLIAALLDAGVTPEGLVWIAMQRVEGVRIDEWCESRQFSPREAAGLMVDVCEAVAHAHRRLVVHRDLKPANILVDNAGRPRLLDFGIAALLDESQAGSAGHVPGIGLTPAYAAPESFRGEDSGTAIDAYGLGAVLFRLVAGCAPFEATGLDASLRGLEPDLAAITRKALAARVSDRYPDATSLSADLRRYLRGLPVKAVGDGKLYRATRWMGRNRLAVTAGALLSIAIIVGFAASWHLAARATREAQRAELEATAANAARADAEQATGRAQAIQAFLVSLFKSARPVSPKDEAPTTKELLAEGARQALVGDELDAPLRIEMLLAIANVYTELRQLESTEPLLQKARELVEPIASEQPELEARVSLLEGITAVGRSEYPQSLEAFARSDAALAAFDPQHPLRVDIEIWRADVDMNDQRAPAALKRLQQLQQAVAQREDIGIETQMRITSTQAWALATTGDLEAAATLMDRLIAMADKHYGRAHLRPATDRGNAAGLQQQLGHFDRAEALLREAIASYDRISEAPMEQRAAARSTLGMLLLARGRYADARAETLASRTEWLPFTGLARVDADPVYRQRNGLIALSEGDASLAVTELQAAQNLVRRPGRTSEFGAIDGRILLAEARCQAGRAPAPAELAALTKEVAETPGYLKPRWAARLAQAQARCDLAAGEPESALDQLEQAQTFDDQLPPGQADEVARRMLMRAESLALLKRGAEAAQARESAVQKLVAAGLENHPLGEATARAAGRE